MSTTTKPAANRARGEPRERATSRSPEPPLASAEHGKHANQVHSELGVGRNIRHARLVAGFTLRELAERVSCSESLLSKIENEKAVPSLQMLHRIVAQLGTSIGVFFSEPHAHSRIVMRQGTRSTIRTGERNGQDAGVSIEWLVPSPKAKLLSGSIHKIPVGGGSQGEISHKGEEMGYVLKGRFELRVSGVTYFLDPGDSFFFPSELPHGYRNPGDTETWVLWANTPPTF